MLKNEVEKVLRFLQQEPGINHGYLLPGGPGDSLLNRTGVLIVPFRG